MAEVRWGSLPAEHGIVSLQVTCRLLTGQARWGEGCAAAGPLPGCTLPRVGHRIQSSEGLFCYWSLKIKVNATCHCFCFFLLGFSWRYLENVGSIKKKIKKKKEILSIIVQHRIILINVFFSPPYMCERYLRESMYVIGIQLHMAGFVSHLGCVGIFVPLLLKILWKFKKTPLYNFNIWKFLFFHFVIYLFLYNFELI